MYLLFPNLLCSVTQLCLTLCDPMDCSRPGSSAHGDSNNTGIGGHALLLGIFPTQGSNPGLPHCRQILCHPGQKGSPPKPRFMYLSSVFPIGTFLPRSFPLYSFLCFFFPSFFLFSCALWHLTSPMLIMPIQGSILGNHSSTWNFMITNALATIIQISQPQVIHQESSGTSCPRFKETPEG